MPRYYFDSHDDGLFIADEVGLDLPNLDAAQVQATRSLGEMARDVQPACAKRSMIIEVRDEGELLLKASLQFEAILVAV